MKFDPHALSESQECDILCAWANRLPGVGEFLISIPNQAICYTNPGVRKKMSRQNVKKGIPDYFLAVVKKGWFGGLWIEMKKKSLKGKPLREEQEYWREKLLEAGYAHHVAFGSDEAMEYIQKYLSLP